MSADAATATRYSGPAERPLTPAARVVLVLAAAGTMLLFYAAAVVWMVLLLALLLLLTIVLIGGARFGLSQFIAPAMVAPSGILSILARHLWLPANVEYRLRLQRADAPRLFDLAGALARRLGIRPPATVVIEMHCGAWVMLHGLHRSTGKTTLGLGYDLLAGLTEREVEAVVAHELAHARLVQRGFSRWLKKGVMRLSNVSHHLAAFHDAREAANQPSELVEWAKGQFGALTLRASRLVATYCRQDEFDADRTAARLCGAAAVRSGLLKLPLLDRAAERLPWNERLARLQGSAPFGQWLVDELGALMHAQDDEPARDAVDEYSIHPSLRDRVHALGAAAAPAAGKAGLFLLAKPDDVARRLATEIQRVAAAQEDKHSSMVARDTKKFCRRATTSAAQVGGIIAFGVGTIMLLFAIFDGTSTEGWIASVVPLAFGALLLYADRYRDRRPLPVPVFGTLNVVKRFDTDQEAQAAEDGLLARYREDAARMGGLRAQTDFLVSACYDALEQRDYLRAHVTARLALGVNGKSGEALLGYAIAAAAFHNTQQTQTALNAIRTQAGLRTPMTKWGAAWALLLLNDWSAEGLLAQLHRANPDVATYAGLLALSQLSRGKVHSAIRHAKAASVLEPRNEHCRRLLIDALLLAGRAREAAQEAKACEAHARTAAAGAFQMVRVGLMLQDMESSNQWAQTLRTLDASGQWLVALGTEFLRARRNDAAATHYAEALTTPYRVQANIGLSVLAEGTGDRARAREYLLAALRLDGAQFVGGETMGSVFHEIIQRLNALDPRRLQCRAWIASISSKASGGLAGVSLLVCGQDFTAACSHFREITTAMHGPEAPFDDSLVNWREAPQEHQPIRPIQPGVQFVMTDG